MIFIVFSFYAFVPAIFASGKNDKNLSTADELIEQGRLNEALRFLEAYTASNPEDFDNAQKRVLRIFRLREEYKQLAEELIRAIQDEPLNDEKKLRLIARLESYEKDPTETEKAFIKETKFAAQFTYYRAMFDAIMTEGVRFSEELRFADSLRRFSDGFVLYKKEFYEDFADTELLDDVDSVMQDINRALSDYNDLQSDLHAAFKKFNFALGSFNADDSLSAYKEVNAVLHKYAAIRNIFAESGFRFRNFFLELRKKDPELTDASFLPFAYRFLLGKDTDSATGIVWSMDTQWELLCAESRTLLGSFMEHLCAETALRLSLRYELQKVFAASDDERILRTMSDVGAMGTDFINLYFLLEHPGRSAPRGFYDAYNRALEYNAVLIADTVKLYEKTEDFLSEKSGFKKLSVPSLQGLSTNQGLIAYSNSILSYAQSRFSDQEGALGRLDFLRNTHINLPLALATDTGGYPWDSLYKSLEKELSLFAGDHRSEGILAWEALSGFVARTSGVLRDRYDEAFNEYDLLLNDFRTSSEPSYPDKALAGFTKLQADLTRDISALQVRSSWLDGAPVVPVKEKPGSVLFADHVSRVAADAAFLNSLSDRIGQRSKTAEQYIFLARQAKNEADFRYEQARNALQREDFDGSREALQIARSKYNEFLMYQEDEGIRNETDKKLDALGLEIVRVENRRVVQDVRLLITDARTLYYAGDFELAERLIIQAEGRWAVTNVEPNIEVSNLKIMIGNALSIRTGRTIPVTDPLYPEMSQTLNAAYQYFEEGKALLRSGKRGEAMTALNAAREKIKDIQVLYPLNQEANLLTLRTAKLVDPDGFDDLFKQRYNTALKEYREPATVNRAYADLKDLYEINPSYPGLKKRIYDVEVELGIIIPPPTPQQLARSKQLVNEAARIFESSSRDELALNNALAKLGEALSLNPQNKDAPILIDRIKTGMGGQSLVVLTADKELLYQQAVQELAKGNTITAAALVADLWKDPKLRNSAKVIDLKKKVDSLL